MEFFVNFDLATLLKAVGYLGISAIIFAESGFLLGFFLPGDSLLFTAGFLASQGYFSITILATLCFAGAVLGDNFGYAFGRRGGPLLFRREDAWFFRKGHLERARLFYERHGGKTVILARFLPVIRTFAPILAGVGQMHYPTFLFFNIIGGALWALGFTFLGYFLGNVIPGADRYIIPLVLVIVILSFLLPLVQVLRDKEGRENLKNLFSRLFRRSHQ